MRPGARESWGRPLGPASGAATLTGTPPGEAARLPACGISQGGRRENGLKVSMRKRRKRGQEAWGHGRMGETGPGEDGGWRQFVRTHGV